MNEKAVLAVDPGSAKCGLALVLRNADGKLDVLWRKVALVAELQAGVNEALGVRSADMIVVGSGTGSREVVHQIRECRPSMGILVVDEHETSLQARERYWEHHKRRGWRRFVPATMQVPPEPFDDFVALILAERVLLV
jgi:RNase H-fold protein (predicted Holliday junction resolvase)